MIYYTIYKTTNLINGKFYIGMHKTKDLDDGYMGSGKLISRAIKKYGIENFAKEILHVFDQEWKMKLAEKILVVTDPEISYNLCPGGHGGFEYINKNKLWFYPGRKEKDITNLKKAAARYIEKQKDKEWRHELNIKISKSMIKYFKYSNGNFLGKSHTSESKEKISLALKNKYKGRKNSQFGTLWIIMVLRIKKLKRTKVFPKDG